MHGKIDFVSNIYIYICIYFFAKMWHQDVVRRNKIKALLNILQL